MTVAKVSLLATAISLALAGTALAQSPDGADPQTFVTNAAQGGMTEVALSKEAATKSADPNIKKFAEHMVKDHTAANDQLMSVADKKGLRVPSSLDAEHQSVVKSLGDKSGADFDAAYAKQMVTDHKKTVALFERAAKSSDADVAAFASKTLPTLKKHKQMADQLEGGSKMSKAGAPGATGP